MPAMDLYTGSPFRLSIRYAFEIADDVLIMSALHGVISPYDRIAPYDVTMADKSKDEIEAWGAEAVGTLTALYPMTRLHLVFFAGIRYIKPLVAPLEKKNGYWTWENPLESMDMFKRIKWLKGQLNGIQERQAQG